MKLNKTEKTATNNYELEIFIEPEQIDEAAGKVYKREAKKYNVPGFRKGKAPRKVIERYYGEDVFAFDAVNELFGDAYEAALKEAELEAVARPDAELVSVSAKDGAVVKVKVVVKPEVKVGKYTGLAATRTVEEIDEAQVDADLENRRMSTARFESKADAPAENGDVVVFDFEGFQDGVAFDGGKGENQRLTLGEGRFIPGFEENLIGHKEGEEFDIDVTFPEEYQAEELAGKPAVFKIKLHQVQKRELPELDDEFAKDVSDFDTLDELKKDIRDHLQKHADEHADNDVEAQLVEQIVETLEGEIPPEMYESQIDDSVRNAEMQMSQQGIGLQDYLGYVGMDMAKFRDGFREQAEKTVKRRLAFEAIAKQEGLKASDEDVEEEIERIAEQYKMEKDQVRNIMPAEVIAEDLTLNKAIDFVKDKAKITEKKAEKKAEKEKPAKAAKKPAAKKEAKADAEAEEKKPAKKPAAKKAAPKAKKESEEK